MTSGIMQLSETVTLIIKTFHINNTAIHFFSSVCILVFLYPNSIKNFKSKNVTVLLKWYYIGV